MSEADGVLARPKTPSPRVGIGLPGCGRLVPDQWAIALALQAWPVGTSIAWMRTVGKSIAVAREQIVEDAIKNELEYLWMLDDDTVPPLDAASQLMYVLEQEKLKESNVRAIGGIYCAKQKPAVPLVFESMGAGPFWKWKLGDIFPIWGIGTGCLMIRVDVFKELPRPWFKTTSEVGFAETDDLYFCNLLAKAGYSILAHGGVICPHWDVKTELVYTLPDGSYPMLPRAPVIPQNGVAVTSHAPDAMSGTVGQ